MEPNTGYARRDTARRHQERSQSAFRCAAALIERDQKARSHPGYESEQTPRSHARMLDLFPPGVLRARPNQGHLMMNSATLIRTFALSAACAAVHAPLAFAADADSSSQARYRSEMAVCESGRSNQDAATCRIESHNALAAARQGVLTDPPGQYGGNAQTLHSARRRGVQRLRSAHARRGQHRRQRVRWRHPARERDCSAGKITRTRTHAPTACKKPAAPAPCAPYSGMQRRMRQFPR